MRPGCEVAKGGENLVNAGGAHQGEADVAQRRQILRAVLCFRPAGVFAHRDVADPVQAIFDAPVAAIKIEQVGSRSALGCEARDCVGNFRGLASLLFGDAFDAADLLETRPIEEFC